jgi:hypothetical protein
MVPGGAVDFWGVIFLAWWGGVFAGVFKKSEVQNMVFLW